MAKNLLKGLEEIEERTEQIEKSLEEKTNLPAGTKLRSLKISDIIPNPKNGDFNQKDIEILADSILNRGLLEPLVVIFKSDSQKYMLISGERRWRAISSFDNSTKAKMFPEGIPCNVVPADTPDDVQEIMLYEANLVSRDFDQGELVKATGRLIELLEKQKEAGKITNIKNYLAKKIDVSPRWAQSLINVEKRLIDGLKKLAGEGKIPVERADKYSSLTAEAQEEILRLINLGETPGDAEIDALKNKAKAAEEEKKKMAEEITKLKREATAYAEAKKSLEASLADVKKEVEKLRKNGGNTELAEKEIKTLSEKKEVASKKEKEKTNELKKAEANVKSASDLKLSEEDRIKIKKRAEKDRIIRNVTKDIASLQKLTSVLDEDDRQWKENILAQLEMIFS